MISLEVRAEMWYTVNKAMQNLLRKKRTLEVQSIGASETTVPPTLEWQGEVLRAPETLEQQPGVEGQRQEAVANTAPAAQQPVTPAQQTVPQGIPIVSLEAIEKVLEEDMEKVYSQLPPEAKPLFKNGGEQAARSIQQLLKKTKVKVAQIRDVIMSWLSVIPGVNKFFLEQEAKLKAEKILRLRDKITKP